MSYANIRALQPNEYGLTFPEWCEAAGVRFQLPWNPTVKFIQAYPTLRLAYGEWKNGVDPTDCRNYFDALYTTQFVRAEAEKLLRDWLPRAERDQKSEYGIPIMEYNRELRKNVEAEREPYAWKKMVPEDPHNRVDVEFCRMAQEILDDDRRALAFEEWKATCGSVLRGYSAMKPKHRKWLDKRFFKLYGKKMPALRRQAHIDSVEEVMTE